MLTNRYYDKSDYCDSHLKMYFNEEVRVFIGEYPNCPACLREKIEQEGRRQLDVMNAALAPFLNFEVRDGKWERAEQPPVGDPNDSGGLARMPSIPARPFLKPKGGR